MAQQGTFREDLDVTDAISALGVKDHGLRSAVMRFERDPGTASGEPFRGGDGPLVCSTSTALVPHPSVVWDVRGYYQRLGFGFPYNPTRRQLRLAAIEAQAENDPLTMYGLLVVLGAKGEWERRNYRSLFLGERYYDPFVQDEIKAEAQRVSSELAAEGLQVSRDEVMEEMGFSSADHETPEQTAERLERERLSSLSEVSGSQFPWSFYVLPPVPLVDLDVLAAWQRELIHAADSCRGLVARELEGFAVGLASGQEWEWNVRHIDGDTVFLIDVDAPPTPDMAIEAMWHALKSPTKR
jgi:hypothetical protein